MRECTAELVTAPVVSSAMLSMVPVSKYGASVHNPMWRVAQEVQNTDWENTIRATGNTKAKRNPTEIQSFQTRYTGQIMRGGVCKSALVDLYTCTCRAGPKAQPTSLICECFLLVAHQYTNGCRYACMYVHTVTHFL